MSKAAIDVTLDGTAGGSKAASVRPKALRAAALAASAALLAVSLSACSSEGSPVENAANVPTYENPRTELDVSDKGASEAQQAAANAASNASKVRDASAYASLAQSVESIMSQYGGTTSVAFVDLYSGNGFDVDGDASQYSASMIKIAVMAELFDRVSAGELSLDQYQAVSSGDIVGGTGTIQSRGAGSYTLDDLCRYMIIYSDNTATNVLIDLLGMDEINAEAAKLGMTGTKLNRHMMDSAAQASGVENYTTCNDLALAFEKIWNGEFYGSELSARALEYLEGQTDSACLQQGLPSGVEFAHKTGNLTNVLNDGGIVEAASPYVIVLLAQDIGAGSAQSLMTEISSTVYDAVA